MRNTAGIIFSNLHDKKLSELTKKRTMGSIPIASRYRMIDFPVSAMVNSGIENIYVIAHHNYHSLTEHIGSGKDYDLARRSGGLRILTPMINAYAVRHSESYDSRLDTLISIYHTLERLDEKYVVMCDCDAVFNCNFKEMIAFHEESGYDLTLMSGKEMDCFVCVATVSALVGILSEASIKGLHSFSDDLINRNVLGISLGYFCTKNQFHTVHSVSDYYECNMRMLNDPSFRRAVLSDPLNPVFTRIYNPPPAKLSASASVKNSLVADGCEIEGSVINSIIFRKVKIGRGAVVSDSIIFEQTDVMENAELRCVIADRGAVIRERVCLASHKSMPIVVASDKAVG